MSEEKEATLPLAPAKYSRYRSVRQQAEASKLPPPPQEQKSQDAQVSRSMSRYRRPYSTTPNNGQVTSPQSVPPMPAIARALMNPVRRVTEPGPRPQRVPGFDQYEGSQASKSREMETTCLQRKTREIRDQEEREVKVGKEKSIQQGGEEQRKVDAKAEEARPADQLLAEQKRKDLQRLEAELDAASPPSMVASPKEKFGFFTRKRAATTVSPPVTAAGGLRSTSGEPYGKDQEQWAEPMGGKAAPTSESRMRNHDTPFRAIEKGGGGVIPGIDAPISAVNAGERRVLIRCKQSSINLPITPETTPVDLIHSAANIMNQTIIPSTAILLESYTQLGLERRIRRYEHIRDVMNSWDRDTQNGLILQNSDSPSHDTDLAASSVSREAPKSVSVHMYHSQKPGKWTKRFVTLLPSGQIYVARKPGAKPTDKETANICHLSDFDIYTPTAQQLRKHLKPPKKHCHAIKSQQKTTMFLSTENFVHFFSTDDDTLAHQWYTAVQAWRSWYLVHKRGGREKPKGKKLSDPSTRVTARLETKGRLNQKLKIASTENPYMIRSFAPLLDKDRSVQTESDSDDEDRPRQIPFHLRNGISLRNIATQSEKHPPPVSYRLPPEAEDEFASSGLLGRTYSQRQRQQKERHAAATQAQHVLEGSSVPIGLVPPPSASHHRSHSVKTMKQSDRSIGPAAPINLQSNPSKREKPKPLLDFTPQFREAPQWDKIGKGHGVAPPTGMPLVEVATTPENPLADIPKATLLRREMTVVRPQTATLGEGKSGTFVKGGLISGT